jgi:LysM repeat protein
MVKRPANITLSIVLTLIVGVSIVGSVVEGKNNQPAPVPLVLQQATPIADVMPKATATPLAQATEPINKVISDAPATITPIVAPSPTQIPPSITQVAATPTQTKYVVKVGDNMFRVARQYNITVQQLAAANNIRQEAILKVGQSLIVPNQVGSVKLDPTNTPVPQNTPQPKTTVGALSTPHTSINGIPIARFMVMPPAVKYNIKVIYAKGQERGNFDRVFSKLGDSTIEPPVFLDRFDTGPYKLGAFDYLQPTIDHFSGSFARQSLAVKRGLSSWGTFDALWADSKRCESNEGPLACEIRTAKPSIIFIRLGSNDGSDPLTFSKSMRKVIAYCIEQGVVPIVATKADLFQDPEGRRNSVLRMLANEFQVPLWDFELLAKTLPNRGLDVDHVHLMTYWLQDYSIPAALSVGHGLHSITGLIALDQVWQVLRNN